MKKRLVGMVTLIIILSSVFIGIVETKTVKARDPFFTLYFLAIQGGANADYGNFLAQQLEQIGIKVEVEIRDWFEVIYQWLELLMRIDIVYITFFTNSWDPDATGLYNENGSSNLGYDTSMDWDDDLGTGKNEWYIRHGNLIMPPDSAERIQHYWEWENYLMDEILPGLPGFSPKKYAAAWTNLKGYSMCEGLVQSWGKMYWNGTHPGQVSTDEFVIAGQPWSDLNPITRDDWNSEFGSSTILDPLIWYDSDKSAWPHLAENYTYLNDTTIQISLREGIKWAPDPEGLFPNEYLDSKDLYFSLYAWKHLSNERYRYDWIKDMKIIDDKTIRIYVDAKPATPEKEPCARSLLSLNTNILPEHYLNQTQLEDGITPDILHPSWATFSTNCFGTGLFELTSFTPGVETILTVRDDCWWLNESITNDPALHWKERFGFTATQQTSMMHQLRIRHLPYPQMALLEFEEGKIDYTELTNPSEKREEYLREPMFEIYSDIGDTFGSFAYLFRGSKILGNRTICPNNPHLTKGLALRKAIAYAIDREEMNNIIHGGDYFITDWPISPKLGIWCNPDIIRYRHYLEKAKEYMFYAGYDVDYTINLSRKLTVISLSCVSFFAMMILVRGKQKKRK
ncbi:MAG: ABC transporter substrate-binding protein [Candidatus Heimdallarchaeota archaeon]|nr:ABC transporter substrate-binding protein [Candidatus Heimdallarchaeota archaeon]